MAPSRRARARDLVLLDRNPLQDINATRAIYALVLRGKVYDRAALDAMLKAAGTRWRPGTRKSQSE
jgi:hypothetical protein